MDVIAIEPHDGHAPGDRYTVNDRQGRQLIDKHLVKEAPTPQNKMAREGRNKSNPSPAAGRERTSSASPAARRSAAKTSNVSARGARAPAKAATKKAPAKKAAKKTTRRGG